MMLGKNEPTGAQLALDGMQLAAEHADAVYENWTKEAYEHLLTYINEVGGSFTCEMLREFAENKEFPSPPNNKAWGGIICKASRGKIIVRDGYTTKKAPHCHNGTAALWKKN